MARGCARLSTLIERALSLLEQAPEVAADNEPLVAGLLAEAGKNLYFLGDFDEALRRTELALDMAERDGLLDVLAYALDTKGILLAARGRLIESEIIELAAMKIASEHNLASATVIAGNAGATLEEADRPEAALAMYEQGEATSRRRGNRRGAGYNILARVQVLIELGRWQEAGTLLTQYLEVDEPLMEAYAPGYVGLLNTLPLSVWRGDLETARRLFERLEPVVVGAEAEARADLRAARALLLNVAGDHEAALVEATEGMNGALDPSFPLSLRRSAPQAVEAAFALDDLGRVQEVIDAVRRRHRPGRQPTMDAHILRWQARLASLGGDDESAAQGFARAVDAFGAVHRPFWVAVTQLEAGEAAFAAGRDEAAESLLARARATFSELQASPWIDRVDGARPMRGAPRRACAIGDVSQRRCPGGGEHGC